MYTWEMLSSAQLIFYYNTKISFLYMCFYVCNLYCKSETENKHVSWHDILRYLHAVAEMCRVRYIIKAFNKMFNYLYRTTFVWCKRNRDSQRCIQGKINNDTFTDEIMIQNQLGIMSTIIGLSNQSL